MDFPDLARTCAPDIHVATLSALVRHESDFNPLAIGVNSHPRRSVLPQSAQGAAEAARALIRAGIDFDAGYGQINVRNWRALGLTPESVFEPCANLTATQRLLTDCYRRAARRHSVTSAVLHATLSCYNTGNLQRGLRNGYVARVLAKAASSLSAVLTESPRAKSLGNAPAASATSTGRRPDFLGASAPDAFSAKRPDAFGHTAIPDILHD